MTIIGAFTLYASVNTYEVISQRDIPYSNAIGAVTLTSDPVTDQFFIDSLTKRYDSGSFGVPQKIKLPEASRHIGIIAANHDTQWKASKGKGHTFLSADKRQKVFGQSVIYLQRNTLTTHNLGAIFTGDVINIVTTEGWQLGYRVKELADDPSKFSLHNQSDTSEIIVILIDYETDKRACFRAILTKVGERL